MWHRADVSIGGAASRAFVNYDQDMQPIYVELPGAVPVNTEITITGRVFYAVDCHAQARQFEVTLAAAPLQLGAAEPEPAPPEPEPAPVAETPPTDIEEPV